MARRHAFYEDASDDGGDGYYYGEEDDEPSSLTRASFVIPCSERKRQDKVAASNVASTSKLLPRLDQYEQTDAPRRARTLAFEEQKRRLDAALESTCDSIFAPLAAQVKPWLSGEGVQKIDRYYIPGLDGRHSRLSVAVLLGPQISATRLSRRLQDWAKGTASASHLVTLSARECASVGQVLRLVTARTEAGRGAVGRSLCSRAIVRILGSERVTASVLNDTLQALHSLNSDADDDAPTYSVLLDAVTGPNALDDKLFPETLPIVDLQRIMTCKLPVGAFETFIEELFLATTADGQAQVVPSGAALSTLRRLYFERATDLDEIVRALGLGLWDHFVSTPEAAFLASDARLMPHDYTDEAISRVRGIYRGDAESLETHLAASRRQTKQNRVSALIALQRTLSDDDETFRRLDAARGFERDRARRFGAVCRSVHCVRRWLSGSSTQESTSTSADQHYFSGPRAAELGGITFALLSGKSIRSLLHDMAVTLRRRQLTELESLWDQLQVLDTLRLSEKHVAVTEVFERILDQGASSEEEDAGTLQPGPSAEVNAEMAEHEAAKMEQKRLEKIQRQLQREETAATIKKEVAERILLCLEDIVPPRDALEETMFVVSNSTYVDMLLNPAPRANVIAALHDPKAYFAAAEESTAGEEYAPSASTSKGTPDISHAFQTYSDAGRLINLADWYTAFVQSIEAEGTAQSRPTANGIAVNSGSALPSTPVKRRRLDNGEGEPLVAREVNGHRSEDEMDEDASEDDAARPVNATAPIRSWKRPSDDMLQVRFALAVHELGRMGFLKRTRRKLDHVLKLVYDLPPAKVPAPASSRS